MFNAIIEFFEAIGKARAASHLANHGYYDLAKGIMLDVAEPQDYVKNTDAQEVHP